MRLLSEMLMTLQSQLSGSADPRITDAKNMDYRTEKALCCTQQDDMLSLLGFSLVLIVSLLATTIPFFSDGNFYLVSLYS